MRFKIGVLLSGFVGITAVLAAACNAQGAEYSAPQVRLPLMATKPAVDGEIKFEEWGAAARMEGFGYGALLSPHEASFWVGADRDELFIAVVSETPPGGKLLTRANPLPGDADAITFYDDTIEMFFDPLRHLGNDKSDRRKVYQAIINARAAIWDQSYKLSAGGEGWRAHWRIGNKVVGDRWHFEVAVPWSDFGVTEADLGQPMGIRIGRNWDQSPTTARQTEWSSLGGAYSNQDTMPVVTFDPAAPVVQVLQMRNEAGQANIKLSIRNPHDQPLEVVSDVSVMPKSSAPAHNNQKLTLGPNETKFVEVTPAAAPKEDLYTQISVASADGQAIYYQRSFSWNLDRPKDLWVLDADAVKKIDTAFAYFPSHDTLKVKVNVGGLESKAQVSAVNLEVRSKGDPTGIASTTMPSLKNDATQIDWKLPKLAEGAYELIVKLDGVPVDRQVCEFVRHRFEWEGNTLGKSDIVLPGFEPIRVKGNTVSTVLREHEMNGLGLWDQIRSQGTPLLKGPMRLEVQTGGKTLQAEGHGLKFTEAAETRLVSQTSLSVGPLVGTATSEWDYDGLMWWRLTLAPTTETIDAVTLVVPLNDQLAPLFHECTDGVRFNYAGFTPPGEGQVWNSTKAAKNSILGSHVPYIWLGGEERGLSVCGENDRGWITDPKVPCQEIVRKADGTLELRLHLIATPSKIDQPREIQVGFQATPVKPMPANWRVWSISGRTKNLPASALQQVFLGSGMYWGTVTPCEDVYPRDQDFSIYDKFAETRRSGQIDQQFVEDWLKRYKTGTDYDQGYRPHIQSGFGTMSGKPQNVLLYTNGRGARFDTPEGQTFIDEWHADAFPPRKYGYGTGVWYDMDPVESFRDYAMWYYKKMFTTFADALYWDDVYLRGNFDTVGTHAYELPDGNIQPDYGPTNMRTLIKRTAVLACELGKQPANMAHMTNTANAQVLAFVQTNLSWEDRSGDAPFQERFSRDYIRAESIGRQFGNVPFVIPLIEGNQEKIPLAHRSFAGATLTHELKNWYVSLQDYWDNFDRLIALGYGTPEAQVFNYWQADYPVKIHDGDTSSIVVSRPNKAIVIVCDYSGADSNPTLELDQKVLGLTGKISAIDMESNQSLELTETGSIKAPLKKYDFRVIQVEAK